MNFSLLTAPFLTVSKPIAWPFEVKWLWNNIKTKSYLNININTLHSSYFYHLCFPWISELHINLAAGHCCITYLSFFQLVFGLYHCSYQTLLLLNSKHKKRFMFSATNALMTSFQFKYIDLIFRLHFFSVFTFQWIKHLIFYNKSVTGV